MVRPVSGVRKVLFVNAHAGNAAALATATDHLRLERSDLQVGAVAGGSSTRSSLAEMTADGADVHANRAETAVMLAIVPELVVHERIATADDPDRTVGLVFRYTADDLSSNGVTGRPTRPPPNSASGCSRSPPMPSSPRWSGRRSKCHRSGDRRPSVHGLTATVSACDRGMRAFRTESTCRATTGRRCLAYIGVMIKFIASPPGRRRAGGVAASAAAVGIALAAVAGAGGAEAATSADSSHASN